MPVNRNAVYRPITMGQAVLTASPAVAYTVPTGKMAVVQQVAVANADPGIVSVFVGLVPRGGVSGLDNRLVHDVDVAPKGALSVDINQVLEAGDMMVGHASAAGALTMTVGGVEFDWHGDTGAWDARLLAETWDSISAGTTWDQWGA